MTPDPSHVSPLRMTAMVLTFPLLGPAVGAAIVVLMFGALGVAAFGLDASKILSGFFLAFFVMLYGTLGPPFLLTGVFYAVAARRLGSQSIGTALLAAVAGFAVWLLGSFLVRGSVTAANAPNHFYDLSMIGMLALPGFLLCWWLVSARYERRPARVNTPG